MHKALKNTDTVANGKGNSDLHPVGRDNTTTVAYGKRNSDLHPVGRDNSYYVTAPDLAVLSLMTASDTADESGHDTSDTLMTDTQVSFLWLLSDTLDA